MPTKPTTTTEALRQIQESLERMEQKADSRPMKLDPVAQARLDGMDERQDEMLTILKEVNGSVREHGQVLASQGQWITDHAQVHTDHVQAHTDLADKVKSVAAKAGISTAIGGGLVIAIGIAVKLLGG